MGILKENGGKAKANEITKMGILSYCLRYIVFIVLGHIDWLV